MKGKDGFINVNSYYLLVHTGNNCSATIEKASRRLLQVPCRNMFSVKEHDLSMINILALSVNLILIRSKKYGALYFY